MRDHRYSGKMVVDNMMMIRVGDLVVAAVLMVMLFEVATVAVHVLVLIFGL